MQKQLLKRNFVAKKIAKRLFAIEGLPCLSFLLRRGEKRAEKKNIQGLLSFPRQISAFNQHGGGEKEEEISPAFFTFLAEKVCRPPWNKRAPLSFQVRYGVKEGFLSFFSLRRGNRCAEDLFSFRPFTYERRRLFYECARKSLGRIFKEFVAREWHKICQFKKTKFSKLINLDFPM